MASSRKILNQKDNAMDSELEALNDGIAEALNVRQEAAATDYGDVYGYCLSKHEESLKILLELEAFLERNIRFFYDPKDNFREKGSPGRNGYRKFNDHNKVFIKPSQTKPIVYIWLSQGIHFILNTDTNKVIAINPSSAGMRFDDDREDEYGDFEDFNFFPIWTPNGEFPDEGYERFFGYPARNVPIPKINLERGQKVAFLKDYKDFVKKVDEDHAMALNCRKLVIEGVKSIVESEKEHLDEIRKLKEQTNGK